MAEHNQDDILIRNALDYFEDAHRLQAKVLGTNHPETLNTNEMINEAKGFLGI